MPDWKTTWQNSTVVRAVINGTRSATPHFSAHAFYHIYEFIDFHPGSPDPSNFQLPEGYYCQGLKGENKTVPQVPSAFSMEFEAVTVLSRNSFKNYTVSTWKVGTICDTCMLLDKDASLSSSLSHDGSFFQGSYRLPVTKNLYSVLTPSPLGMVCNSYRLKKAMNYQKRECFSENVLFSVLSVAILDL